jgi:hypothetical protein
MTREERIQAAIKGIRKFHELGGTVPGRRYDHEVKKRAADLGRSDGDVRKARKFHEVYTKEEVEDLCLMIASVQKNQPDDAPIFSRTHVVRLLSAKPRDRKTLQKNAIKNAWSVSKLQEEITLLKGQRRAGGRPPNVGHGLTSLCCNARGKCETWLRWLDAASASTGGKPGSVPAGLPKKLENGFAAARREMSGLVKALTDEIERPKKG